MKVQLNSGAVAIVSREQGLELINAKGGKEIVEEKKAVKETAKKSTKKATTKKK